MKSKKSREPEQTAETSGGTGMRAIRFLKIVQALREDPHQTLEVLTKRVGIGRSQFYKDKNALAELGFKFEYSKATGFKITSDSLTPIVGMSLSDRLLLMFALEQMSSGGDGTLSAMALDIGKKLVGDLPSPFREHMFDCFDRTITKHYEINPDILSSLREAIIQSQRLRILYTRSETWDQRWRKIDPRHIFMRQKTLYLYARTVDEIPPQWKVFRISRIAKVQQTGISITWNIKEDDGFQRRLRNAWNAFLGDTARPVTIRFTGQAVHYVSEKKWHWTQQVQEEEDGSILFTVRVAEPQEVVRWSRQFGDEAAVVSIGEPEEEE